MSTLDDLRATLERRADAVDDDERYARVVGVRSRIRAVRRRRSAVMIVTAVLVVLAGVAGTGLLRGPRDLEPAGRVVAGVHVPGSVEVLTFPYRLTGVVDLTSAPTRVGAADHDRAVVLAASGLGTGSATLYSDDAAVARVRGDGKMSVPVALDSAGADMEVRFDGAGTGARAGVAVYEATGALPEGVSQGPAVFREQVAGAPLLAAVFSSPGADSAELRVDLPRGPVRFAFYCTAPDDWWVVATMDARSSRGTSCGATVADAGAGPGAFANPLGREHDVRVSLRNEDVFGDAEPPTGVVFGVGIYGLPSSSMQVLDADVPDSIEQLGREWVLERVLTSPAVVDTSDGDVLLGLAGRGLGVHAVWSGRLTMGTTTRVHTKKRTTFTFDTILLAGDSYDVRIRADEDGKGRLLVYRPVDEP
jgi:hypothetical protein